MTNKEAYYAIYPFIKKKCLSKVAKVLAGVQGPEQGLVGDVAERQTQQGHAEETKSGERGVGEIVGAPELRRYMDRTLTEARQARDFHDEQEFPRTRAYHNGQVAAMENLKEWLDCRTAKRSDLSNDQGHAAARGGLD